MNVRISAVVCTHNRAAYLRKALQSLVDQTLSEELYEIIVVDNNSEDNTKEVVAEFSNVPNVHYLYEPVTGIAFARNTAWRNARGEYVAFLDDDAIASTVWLEKFLEVFDSYEPKPGSAGGECRAIWEAPQPKWLSDAMLGHLSIFHWSDVPIILRGKPRLSSCNLAIPRELLQKAGGFLEDLGRRGDSLLTGEETYLLQQLDSWGFCAVYHPELVVGHHVSASRLTKRYFRRIVYVQGIADAIMLAQEGPLSLALRARKTLNRIGWALPRLFLMLVSKSSAARFRRQCQVLEAMGYISGLWRRGAALP